MNIVIGVQTCNRLEYTKRTIEAVIRRNPESKDMPWVISDDGSTDGTREYIDGLSFINESNFYPKQTGITRGLERLVGLAVKHGDIILYLQNDWEQIRWIDFKSVEEFYEKYSNAGHIAMITDKGRGNDQRLSAFGTRINLYTKEKFEPGKPIIIGKEKFIPGNWSYADIPGFTNLKFAIRMFDNNIFNEFTRLENIHKSGCDNYLLDNQPYFNIDYKSKESTVGKIK